MTGVLVVDDEPQIVRALRIGLRSQGYDVRVAGNGETALEMVATHAPDVVVLDLGLPGIDGAEVARRIRSFSDVPIVVLSAREREADKVAALDAGADDYLTKPFGMDELLARIRAVLRRVQGTSSEPVLRFDDLVIDLSRRLVTRSDSAIHLTKTEYDLLEAFVTHPGKLLTHRWLLGRVWGGGYADESQYVRVYVGQLRKKLGDNSARPRWILTEPGMGYRWSP